MFFSIKSGPLIFHLISFDQMVATLKIGLQSFSPSYVGGLVVPTCFRGPQLFLAFAAEINFV